MQDDFSIDQRAKQIFDTRTRDYFSEVASCYAAGNYRSAVVMLWSVAVCDLLFKLQNLVDLYGDPKAKKILEEISKLQQDNERSPVWETKLVEQVAEQTQLLDIAERENLLHLQKQRHLAAHPIVNANLQLHRPNRDTARALIRNTLDGLLTKAPILSKQILDELVVDLEQASGLLIDDKKLKAYIESKYYNRFNPEVEKAVFRALWKLVFRLIDERCDRNRLVNYKALKLLYGRNVSQFKAQIRADRDYFSSISSSAGPVVYLIHFLSRDAEVYDCLADHAKAAIQHVADSDPSARCLAWFLSDSLEQHVFGLCAWLEQDGSPQIDEGLWQSLKDISDSHEWEKLLRRFANCYYGASGSYNSADQRYFTVISDELVYYDRDDLIDLLERIERNSQTYGRGRSSIDHVQIRDRMLSVEPQFDFSTYKRFLRSIE